MAHVKTEEENKEDAMPPLKNLDPGTLLFYNDTPYIRSGSVADPEDPNKDAVWLVSLVTGNQICLSEFTCVAVVPPTTRLVLRNEP